MTAEAVDEKVAIVHAAAGARLGDIEFNVRAFLVQVTDERQAAIEQVAGFLEVDPAFVERVAVRADRRPRRRWSTTCYAAASAGGSAT